MEQAREGSSRAARMVWIAISAGGSISVKTPKPPEFSLDWRREAGPGRARS